jgi:DNA-binding SARP family transcriptional activator
LVQIPTELRLCGPLEVTVEGSRVESRLRGAQVVTVLAALALARPRALARDELIDVLWPEELPGDAGAILSTLLSRLRRALGPDMVVGRRELALNLGSNARVDVESARELVGLARSSLASGALSVAWSSGEEAAALLAGGLLPGLRGYWVARRRDEVAALEADALEVAAEARLLAGGADLAGLDPIARTLIARAPFRESGHRALMESLASRGNVAEALRVYEDLRMLLREELGTTPSAAMRELHRRLLRDGESPAWMRTPEATPLAGLPAALIAAPGPFVGRAEAVAALRGALHDIAPTGRGLVLLAGEPGIGKTRLAAEFAAAAQRDGALVLYGHCDDDAPIPFQPFVEALREWAAAAPAEELGRLAGGAHELAALLPELRRRLGTAPAANDVDPETRRYRLFESIQGLLSALPEPVVLVLDDLQWATAPTLVLLRHVLRPGPGRVLVVGAYRPAEAGAAVADLRHEGLELTLGGLDADAVADLVRAAGASADSNALHRDTGGNPLFVGEVLRHLAETGTLELPTRVRDVIARRVERLPADAQRALAVAAVAGAEFELEVVAAVAEISADALAETLEAAVEASLVNEIALGRYGFAHALVRAAIEGRLTATRRARLHRRIAEALEASGTAGPAEVAHHRYEAGDPDELVNAAVHAAHAATRQLGYEEAALQYERAVAAARTRPGFDRARLADLELALAEAYRDAGLNARAPEPALAAGQIARERDDAGRLARAALLYAGPGIIGVSDPGAVALLEEAAAELAARDDVAAASALRARVLSRLAFELYWTPLRDRRRALAHEAVELCRAAGDARSLGLALTAEHACAREPGALEEREAMIAEAANAARLANDPDLTLETRLAGLGDRLERGDIDALRHTADAIERTARALQRPRWLPYPALLRATYALATGDDDAAAAQVAEADAISRRLNDPNVIGMVISRRAILGIARGGEGLERIERVVASYAQGLPGMPIWRLLLAWVQLELGHEADARANLDRALQRDLPKDAFFIVSAAVAAELIARLRDPERAGWLYPLLLPYRARHAVAATDFTLGSVERPLGLLAVTLGDPKKAAEHQQAAAASNARSGIGHKIGTGRHS